MYIGKRTYDIFLKETKTYRKLRHHMKSLYIYRRPTFPVPVKTFLDDSRSIPECIMSALGRYVL